MSSAPHTLALNLTRDELIRFCEIHGYPPYRGRQLWQWLHVQRVTEWNEMRNLPRSMREKLAASLLINGATPSDTHTSPDGTAKILAQLPDGDAVETVIIPAAERRTVCVSTQLGCRYGCSFCASGQAGLHRNLETGEIVGQVLMAARLIGDRPSNVVYMGIGEPLDNYDHVLKSVRIINAEDGMNIGARRITISTCGLIPEIQRLASEGLQIELSVSLHAIDDTLRSEMMPVNRKYPVGPLLDACRAYVRQTHRIVTFEYTLIRGVNDSVPQAARLAAKLKTLPCRVNLIPLSPVPEFPHATPSQLATQSFVRILAEAGINTTIRASRGAGVSAACGQLRFSRERQT